MRFMEGAGMTGGFAEFFQTATGRLPDAAQVAMAEEGLPAELRPAVADTTATAVLPWLYRRLVAAPGATPRRLVYVLPADSLPERAAQRIGEWVAALGDSGARPAADVGVHLVAGAVRDGRWQRAPERTAIVVGTHDLVLSRALMRGFADFRWHASIGYGLLHNDAQWVFDGAHRLGPGLPTSRRLQRLRDELGTAAPTASLWMYPAATAGDPLPVGGGEPAAARRVLAAHVAGTQTVAVLGSVARARRLQEELRAARPEQDVVLVHPYFRTAERRDLVTLLGDRDRDRIIVGTRALEAALDLRPRTLLVAEDEDEDEEKAETEAASVAATADTETASHDWTTADLLALFDTAVDPPGLDVGGWVCAAADRAVLVAWRAWESGEPAEDEPDAGRDELCPVPLAELARVLDGRAWLRDPGDGLWRRAVAADLAPGVTVLLDAARGGYLPGRGWAPDSTAPVPVLGPGPEAVQLYGCGAWVSLDQHLRETEEEARRLADALPGLPRAHQEAVILAARYHDLGKCHDAFQEMLRSGGGEAPDILLAKSMAPFSTGRHTRTGFRHELVSALLLADDGHWHGGLDGTGTDHRLVIYLAAAHHGRVRMSVPPQGEDVPGVLGVLDGDRTPPVVLSSGETFPAQVLRTDGFRPGVGGPWSEQARALRDRDDLGPFRLAYLETLVRVSDWLSSARHDVPVAAAEPTAERPAAEPAAEPSAESAAT